MSFFGLVIFLLAGYLLQQPFDRLHFWIRIRHDKVSDCRDFNAESQSRRDELLRTAKSVCRTVSHERNVRLVSTKINQCLCRTLFTDCQILAHILYTFYMFYTAANQPLTTSD